MNNSTVILNPTEVEYDTNVFFVDFSLVFALCYLKETIWHVFEAKVSQPEAALFEEVRRQMGYEPLTGLIFNNTFFFFFYVEDLKVIGIDV